MRHSAHPQTLRVCLSCGHGRGRCARLARLLLTGLLLTVSLAMAGLTPDRAGATATLSWSAPATVDFGQQLNGISCPSRALCVAVDGAGRVLAGAALATGGFSWELVASDPLHALSAVSCASPSLCAAVDGSGRVIVSTSPASVGGWQPARSIDGSNALTAIACPTESLCVAVDRLGKALVSAAPATASQPWSERSVDPKHALESVSCPSAQLCVAVDDAGTEIAIAEPAGPSASWRSRAIDSPLALSGVSCAPTVCVAVDGQGDALASADPGATAPTWSSTGIDTHALTGVSCASSGVCVAVDGGERPAGEALASEAPAGPLPVWSSSRADPGTALRGVSCNGENFCAAVAEGGRVITASILVPEANKSALPEVAQSAPALVRPHPFITGVPAVGDRLLCNPGVPEGSTATLSYAWWRDDGPIAGASGAAYRVAPADATHHLQCLVTAADAEGSVTSHSAFVAVPAQGILAAVDETSVGRARVAGDGVSVLVRCSPRAVRMCAIALRLSTVRAIAHRRVTVTVGSLGARLRPGQRRTLSVSLDALGRRLLARSKRLTVALSVSGTVIGVLRAALSRQRLTLVPARSR